MALDLGLTTCQLLSAMDSVDSSVRNRGNRLIKTLGRAQDIPVSAAESCTAAVGRRPYISARTGPEGLLDSIAPLDVPADWTAVAVDGSHIDVDRHLPLRCHLINLGGCVITYGKDPGCELFSEPALAVDDDDLYLRPPDGTRGEALIAGPLLGALRTVREVERLADAIENLPDDRPALALLDGTLRPSTGPATWPPASPWAWPPARSGATSITSTAAPRSPGWRSPTGWPTIPSCWP